MHEYGAHPQVIARAPVREHRRPNAMTSTANVPLESRFRPPLLERLEREHFPASHFTEPRPGTIAAQFLASRLTSAFQPIVRASDGGVAGHHGLLRVFDAGAQAAADATLVQLDRLARTLHALNYFSRHEGNRSFLYLNIEERLLSMAADNDGAYFELILEELRVPTSRIAIVLPSGALDAPRAERSDHTRRLVDALSRRGIHAIARRIEDEAQAQAARDVGFGFLQGRHFAPTTFA